MSLFIHDHGVVHCFSKPHGSGSPQNRSVNKYITTAEADEVAVHVSHGKVIKSLYLLRFILSPIVNHSYIHFLD